MNEVVKEEKGIENILEIIDGIELVGVNVAAAFKDGKIGLEDLPLLVNILKDVEKLINAGKDAREVVPEVKNVDQAELITIGTRFYTMVKNIVDAKKAE